jgi:hypothetical protein
MNDKASEPAQKSPYERLREAARAKMAALYPDKAKPITAGKYWRLEDTFTMDALSEKGKHMMIHRASEERQAEEIGDNPAAIFEGLSESMIAFYRKRLDETKPGK